jgi:hypothetical protein
MLKYLLALLLLVTAVASVNGCKASADVDDDGVEMDVDT